MFFKKISFCFVFNQAHHFPKLCSTLHFLFFLLTIVFLWSFFFVAKLWGIWQEFFFSFYTSSLSFTNKNFPLRLHKKVFSWVFSFSKVFIWKKKAKNWRIRLERGRCDTFRKNTLCAEIEHKTFHSIHFHPFALTRKQNFLIFRHCVGILMEILSEKRFFSF